jgi:hypothetical protein
MVAVVRAVANAMNIEQRADSEDIATVPAVAATASA